MSTPLRLCLDSISGNARLELDSDVLDYSPNTHPQQLELSQLTEEQESIGKDSQQTSFYIASEQEVFDN